MTTYFRVIIWKPEHDEFVRKAFQIVFNKPLAQKTPRQDRITGQYMVGTAMFTAEREAQLSALMKGKGSIRADVPKMWWDV